MNTMPRARSYNYSHVVRPHTGGPRISIHWTWSYPWESQRDPAHIYNRFSTITEMHNIAWPAYETPEYDAAHFLQGIAGTLELFHRSTLSFQELAEEDTGHPVPVLRQPRHQRSNHRCRIDDRAGIAHRCPGVGVDGGDRSPDRRGAGHHQRKVRAMSDTRGHHRAVAVRRIATDQNLAAGSDGAGGADCLGDDAPDTLPELARPARSRGPAITGAEPGC
jgi:hypothetical protein